MRLRLYFPCVPHSSLNLVPLTISVVKCTTRTTADLTLHSCYLYRQRIFRETPRLQRFCFLGRLLDLPEYSLSDDL